MHAEFVSSIAEIEAAQWNALWPSDYPFTQHAFLLALEASGSTSAQTGWQPRHVQVKRQGKLLAAMVLYEKTHSYGEYVFDWGWADAYSRAGLAYYPKLLCAIPFTPATGPRMGFCEQLTAEEQHLCTDVLSAAVTERLAAIQGSGFHCLFPSVQNRQLLAGRYSERQGCQFHWFNRDYTTFDDFLASFASRKRKNIKRERRKMQAQGICLQMRTASDVSDDDWRVFAALYQRTYFKRSGHQGYLNKDFFQRVARQMPQQVLMCSAHSENLQSPMLAAALYFRDSTTLYGRYWGACSDIDGLHFETCYYQGIDYAIAAGLQRFDPGAQGEHKIQRGFTPVKTCSYHWLEHPGFRSAVDEFVLEERTHNDNYCEDARRYLPFKEGEPLIEADFLLTDQRCSR